MSSKPCMNPNCKSYGSPHPNCRCYAGMAKGGMTDYFCSTDRMHDKNCKYYADGGEVTLSSPEHTKIDTQDAVAGYLVSQGAHGLLRLHKNPGAEHFERTVKAGHREVKKHIDAVFNNGEIPQHDLEQPKKMIKDWIDRGGITDDLKEEMYRQNLAHGGDVKKPPLHSSPELAEAYPEQNMMLQTARGRISNYLNTLKPQNSAAALPFDSNPKNPESEKAYDKAVHIAAHPLSVMEKVKQGSLANEDRAHLKALHPEVDDYLQKKVTEELVKGQLEGKKPKHSTRHGLSVLMGTPLSSEDTPAFLQATQAIFSLKTSSQNNNTQAGSPETPHKSKGSALTNSDQAYLTGAQAVEKRQQRVPQ